MGLPAYDYYDDKGFENYNVLEKKTLNFLDALANSNKYYTVEIHESNGKYRIFTEYGRINHTPRRQVRYPENLLQAQKEFESIVRSKIRKGYKEVALIQSNTGSEKGRKIIAQSELPDKPANPSRKKKSSLHPVIVKFVEQIFDEANMKLTHLVHGSRSTNRSSPLGILSLTQINKGREVLERISGIIGTRSEVGVEEVIDLCNEYFSLIPRAFGKNICVSQIVLNTQDKINEELEILKFFEDSLKIGDISSDDVDKKYESLKSDIELLDPASSEYEDIVHYVVSTESVYHSVHLDVKNIFAVRQKNAPAFDDHYGNIKSLFHGSRSANLPGILSSHLKLPTRLPAGVTITGAMFGPGIYFADQSTKSSQYSCSRFGGTANKYPTAFMFLCDVALGRMKEEYYSRYYTQPPEGYDSVKGVAGRSLLHNEYIIYRENQQRITHIIEFSVRDKK